MRAIALFDHEEVGSESAQVRRGWDCVLAGCVLGRCGQCRCLYPVRPRGGGERERAGRLVLGACSMDVRIDTRVY